MGCHRTSVGRRRDRRCAARPHRPAGGEHAGPGPDFRALTPPRRSQFRIVADATKRRTAPTVHPGENGVGRRRPLSCGWSSAWATGYVIRRGSRVRGMSGRATRAGTRRRATGVAGVGDREVPARAPPSHRHRSSSRVALPPSVDAVRPAGPWSDRPPGRTADRKLGPPGGGHRRVCRNLRLDLGGTAREYDVTACCGKILAGGRA